MPDALPIRGSVWEDSGCSLMARIVGGAATNVVQADLSSITYAVYKSDGTEIIASTAATISSVVFDTLQTDARWTKDSTGYNFRLDALTTWFPAGAATYFVEIKFTPTSGAAYHVVFEVAAKNLFRS